MVVSFVPHFNRALQESFERAFPGRPFVTVLTDLADYPPHFWIERKPQYFVCGTDKAVAQARAMGHADDRIFRASGMILHPRFYEAPVENVLRSAQATGVAPRSSDGAGAFRRARVEGHARNCRAAEPLESSTCN